MFKKILLVGVALWLLVPMAAGAEQVRAVVTPFSVHSQEDIDYLVTGLQKMMITHLMQRGVEVSPAEGVNAKLGGKPPTSLGEAGLRDLGRSFDATYVVVGSMTKVGRQVSLDARVIDVQTSKIRSVYVQETGLENLNAATGRLAMDIVAGVSSGGRVAEIAISGNDRIESDAIRRVLTTQVGGPYNQETVSEDLKNIYNMDYFDDVQVAVSDGAEGKVITFTVKEKPTIQRVDIKGNREVTRDKLVDVLGYSLHSIMNPKKIVGSINNMKSLYHEKGYYNAEISYSTEELGPKQVAVVYTVQEGPKILINRIQFEGNEAFSDAKLRRQMGTSERNWFSWFLGGGMLDEEKLKGDIARVNAFYLNNGYIKARVGAPQVTTEGKGLVITIPVEEGPQYKVGTVGLAGDLVVPEEQIRNKLALKSGDIFNRETVVKDQEAIGLLTADQGYAYCEIDPVMMEHVDNLTVDITYTIKKKGLVTFERITIIGNDKTRDKVIRRELKVREGDLFSASKLQRSTDNLNRLGFFEEVQMNQNPGSADDTMNLEVEVKEMPTGAFSVGVGYSSFNQVFGTMSISQDNLWGRGQQLKLETTIGANEDQYLLSFTEPWLFDIPLSAGFDVFHTVTDYSEYSKRSSGFAVRGGYPLIEDLLKLSARYRYEFIDIYDVDNDAATTIKEIKGEAQSSSFLTMITYDSRNRFFNPTKGWYNSASWETAGGVLGGTISYDRFTLEVGRYFPLPIEETAFHIRAKWGYIVQGPDGDLPAYEKFYLGGINSVRGYKWTDISPKDPVTGDSIGGEKMAFANFEFIFPILKNAGLSGVVFYDVGNVWTKDQDYSFDDVRSSYGGGFRYLSPLGPLRIEYGRVIDPRDDEAEGNWEFSMGTTF